jgi:hypothetical protein
MGETMRTELKPCPFCESANLRVAHVYNDEDWCVQCCDCWSAGGHGHTKAEAIAAWNRRAPTPAIDYDADADGELAV